MAQPIHKSKLAQEKKDLARRARRLAETQPLEADRTRLTQFAAELDSEAEALERPTLAVSPPRTAVPHQQVQQQEQQQQSVGSSTQSRPPKEKDQARVGDAGSACDTDR